jgi:tetratricopeptide (TPR) repeat protein
MSSSHRPDSHRRFLTGGGRFVWLYLVTRPPWTLVRGLPALAVLIGVCLSVHQRQEDSRWTQVSLRYQRAAQLALKGQNLEAAELWFRKVITLNPADEVARFQLALTREANGQQPQALRTFMALAPIGERGYVPAHVHLARQILADREHLTRERLDLAARHLQSALEQQPDHDQARTLLAELRFNRGQLQEAADLLSAMTDRHPEAHLMLAGIALRLDRAEQAEDHATRARLHFQQQLQQDSTNLTAVLGLADSYAVVGRFVESEQVLTTELTHRPNDNALKVAFLKLALLEVEHQLSRPAPDWDRTVLLLDRSLVAFPDNSYIFTRIAQVAARSQGAEGQALRVTLENALADGRAPAICHLLLGNTWGEQGEFDRAVQHLRAAQTAYPESPVVLNNLAWFLMKRGSTAELEEALNLANQAYEAAPQVLEIRETRGQILARLGRDLEALADLEAALPLPQTRVEVHRTLEMLYERLGNAEMAARHRARAAAMEPAGAHAP